MPQSASTRRDRTPRGKLTAPSIRGAACMICANSTGPVRFVTTHLYAAAVSYDRLVEVSKLLRTPGGTKDLDTKVPALHFGIRLPESHLTIYRSMGISRHYLPALAGDTTGLELRLREMDRRRSDGSVQGRLSPHPIPAERVDDVMDDIRRAIDIRHDRALLETHCRGHEIDEVVAYVDSLPLPVLLRWNPGEFVRPQLHTPSPYQRLQPKPYREVLIRSQSEIRSSYLALIEAQG